ncbi:GerMN domain-containing protein [Paenibacillus sanguinis]|uniref:GerMN domain-containing protein n=1 Tax=Paenibacillus sanguinis TaxID=225906 RepID=UPI00036C5713|nr:GerMN domain-containing protein [Paenibacillus sanguinis]
MNRKGMILGVLALVLMLSTSCGQKPGASPGPANTGTNQGSGVTDPQVTDPSQGAGDVDQPGQSSAAIEVYFADEQMMDLTKLNREISFQADGDKYLEALKALQVSGDSQLLSLWDKVEFHKAELKDGTLTVDLSLPDEARLGAGGEALALDALRNTMFQFNEVEAIELLVDGQQVDTLMGHVELEHPLTRN